MGFMGGGDGMRRLMDKDVVKPKSVSATLARFWPYFRQRWYALIIVLILMFATTWTQIESPKLLGQAVDCYIITANPFASLMQSNSNSEANQTSTCWFDSTDFSKMPPDQARDAKISGLLRLVLTLVGLFVAGSALSGVMFYFMTWAGQHALREIRVGVFKHAHRLSLGFYAEHEAGDIMSRFTNDSETIQQVLSFALVNVLSSILLIIWVVITMLQTNVPYALLSLSVVPFMAIATVYFSGQARKAFRKSREEMGSVNANLQESIAGVREVQAFNREEENIEDFKRTNAANRDANVRAAAFTSALNPILEALGYAALAIVVVVGGLSVLRNEPLLGT